MYRLSIAFAVLAAWVLIHSASSALAQNDNQGSVEVNLDVLKDIREYQPPPMFDNKQAPLTGHGAPGGNEVKKFPMAVETRHNTMNPNFQPHQSAIPAQQPVKATMSPIIEVERVPVATPSLPINPESHYAPAAPPIPGKKPDSAKNHRVAVAPPIPEKRPEKLNASQEFIESAALAPTKVEEIPLPAAEEEKASDGAPVVAEVAPSTPEVAVEPAETPEEQPPTPPEDSSLAAFEDPAPAKPEETPAVPAEEPDASANNVLAHAMQVLTFPFMPGSTEMDQDSRRLFDDQAVTLMKGNPDIRVQVQAYATPSDEGQSSARRLSLTRAMTVRSYLIEHEIDPRRIDIRALGEQTGPGPQDRVDLVFVNKNEAM